MMENNQKPCPTAQIHSTHCDCYVRCLPCPSHRCGIAVDGFYLDCPCASDCGTRARYISCEHDPSRATMVISGMAVYSVQSSHCRCFLLFEACSALGAITSTNKWFRLSCGCVVELMTCRQRPNGSTHPQLQISLSNKTGQNPEAGRAPNFPNRQVSAPNPARNEIIASDSQRTSILNISNSAKQNFDQSDRVAAAREARATQIQRLNEPASIRARQATAKLVAKGTTRVQFLTSNSQSFRGKPSTQALAVESLAIRPPQILPLGREQLRLGRLQHPALSSSGPRSDTDAITVGSNSLEDQYFANPRHGLESNSNARARIFQFDGQELQQQLAASRMLAAKFLQIQILQKSDLR